MRENSPGPSGWALKLTLAALPRLGQEPLTLAHGALLSSISEPNAVADYLATASSDYNGKN